MASQDFDAQAPGRDFDRALGQDGPFALSHAAAAVIAFLFVALFTVVPILLHPILPLIDLPNHIARHHIMATTSGPLLTYYQTSTTLIPNAAADLLWRMTGFPGDPIVFSQRLMAAYALLLTASAMILARTVQGRWTVWSAVTGLLVYNSSFYWGFQNFVVGLPFALAALAIWIGTERRHILWRLVLLTPFATAIYLMHFYVFFALAVAAAGREVQLLWTAPRGQRRRQFLTGLTMALVFLPGFVWVVIVQMNEVRLTILPYEDPTKFGGFAERLKTVIWPLYATSLDWFAPLNLLNLMAYVALLGALVTLYRKTGPRLVLAPQLIGPVLALVLLTLLTPAKVNGMWPVQVRPPVVLLLLLVAGTRWEGLSRRNGILLATVFASLIAARGVVFERVAAINEAEMADLSTVLTKLPKGERLLPVRAANDMYDRRLFHAAAYAVTWRDAFVPTLFQGSHALWVRPEWLASSHPALYPVDERLLFPELSGVPPWPQLMLQDWQHKFTYALLEDEDPVLMDHRPEFVRIIRSGRFTLYRIDPSLSPPQQTAR